MEARIQAHTALRKRLAALSVDPYLFTDADLSCLCAMDASIGGAATEAEAVSVFTSLCDDVRARAEAEMRACETARDAARARLRRASERLTDGASRVLSLPIFADMTSAWFSRPSDESYRALEAVLLSLVSECEGVRAALVGETRENVHFRALSSCRRDVFLLRVAGALAASSPLHPTLSSVDALSEPLSRAEALEKESSRYRETGYRLAVEPIPLFLGKVRVLLDAEKNADAARPEIRLVYREVQAFREQVRQTADAILNIKSGGKPE